MSSVSLTQAVTSGDADKVKAVLANGAEVNERTGGGQTPLILATIFGHTHLIPLLLDAGADPQLQDNLGLNAIDWAQRRGATEAIDMLSNRPSQSSITSTTASLQTLPARSTTSRPSDAEKSAALSDEERSRRWIAGLKQRIAEQSQREVPDGPNIFRPNAAALLESLPLFSSGEREPQPEIPAEPSTPQPELPATPLEPEPEIPAPRPDPQPDSLPDPGQPEPESFAYQRQAESSANSSQPESLAYPKRAERELFSYPGQPRPEFPVDPEFPANVRPESAAVLRQAEEESPPERAEVEAGPVAAQEPVRRSNRKRCPKCNAVYNSDLIAYCAHHIVPLVDDDEPAPVISQPQTTSPVLFWTIIVITLAGSLMVGSILAAYLYSPKKVQPEVTTAAPPPTPRAVQKGTPVVGKELDDKVLSLPIAECPLNNQEAIPGTVVVRVTVNKAGQVTKAQASGADWLLRGAASEAAMKSTFAPEKLRRRTTQGTITYTFGT